MIVLARPSGRRPSGNAPRREQAERRRGDRRRSMPALEALENRELLSFYTGPARVRPVLAAQGAFLIQVAGPGAVEVHPASGGGIDLKIFGTSTSSTVTISLEQPRPHFSTGLLPINQLVVTSGQLGSLEAPDVDLTGKMSALSGSMSTLELGGVGPKAQVDVSGGVGTLDIQTVNLGPTGHVAITNDLSGGEADSAITIGTMNLNGGLFEIGPDADGTLSILGSVGIHHNGLLFITRDLGGTSTIGGSVTLDTGGQIRVGRNLSDLTITGDLVVSPLGSGISVGGALNDLTINGYFQGQGGTSAPTAFDLGVGLNLTGLSILGGVTGVAGLINANIRAGGSITGVNIPYGISNSTIQPNTPPPPLT
jgi:hypothetical protein